MAENKRENVVEKGEGIRGDGERWEYVSNVGGKVVVEVWDLAGNIIQEDV